MKTITGYHGTTRENAINILNGGVKTVPTWNVSDDEYLYLWCPHAFLNGEYPEAEDMGGAEDMAIRNAFESAQITASMSDEPQKELVVLCFSFPENIILKDDSCENMDLARRVEDFEGLEKGHIKTYTTKHNSRLDALIICQLLENPYFEKYNLDSDLIEAAEAMKDVYIESIHDFDWNEE